MPRCPATWRLKSKPKFSKSDSPIDRVRRDIRQSRRRAGKRIAGCVTLRVNDFDGIPPCGSKTRPHTARSGLRFLQYDPSVLSIMLMDFIVYCRVSHGLADNGFLFDGRRS